MSALISKAAAEALNQRSTLVTKAPDPINPAHYRGDSIMRIIEEFDAGFCLRNVVKYVLRAKEKNGIEDLKKGLWYLNREIARQEKIIDARR